MSTRKSEHCGYCDHVDDTVYKTRYQGVVRMPPEGHQRYEGKQHAKGAGKASVHDVAHLEHQSEDKGEHRGDEHHEEDHPVTEK